MKNRISNLMFISIVVIASVTTGCVNFQQMAYDARIKQFERNVQKSVESDFDLDFYNKKPLEEKIDWLKFASEECLDKGDMDAVAIVRRAGSRLYNETSEKEFLEIIPWDSETTVQGLFFILAQGKDYRYGYESSYLWMEDAEALDVLNKYTESAVALLKDWSIPDDDIKDFLCYCGGKEIKAVSHLWKASHSLETYAPVIAEAYDNSAKIILRYAYVRDYLHGYDYNGKYSYWGENYYSYSSANEIVSDCLSDPLMLSEALKSAQEVDNEEKIAMIRELMGDQGSIAKYRENKAIQDINAVLSLLETNTLPDVKSISADNHETFINTVDSFYLSLNRYSYAIPDTYITDDVADAFATLYFEITVRYSAYLLFMNDYRTSFDYEKPILQKMYDSTFFTEGASKQGIIYCEKIGNDKLADIFDRLRVNMQQKRDQIIQMEPNIKQ